MNLDLSGKVALITGASRGLGYATAFKLAQEGANLVINSRNEENINSAAKIFARNVTLKLFQFLVT